MVILPVPTLSCNTEWRETKQSRRIPPVGQPAKHVMTKFSCNNLSMLVLLVGCAFARLPSLPCLTAAAASGPSAAFLITSDSLSWYHTAVKYLSFSGASWHLSERCLPRTVLRSAVLAVGRTGYDCAVTHNVGSCSSADHISCWAAWGLINCRRVGLCCSCCDGICRVLSADSL